MYIKLGHSSKPYVLQLSFVARATRDATSYAFAFEWRGLLNVDIFQRIAISSMFELLPVLLRTYAIRVTREALRTV